jgi:MFS family permease
MSESLRHNHDFTALWVGQTVSELGTRVSLFVLPLITYAMTGSTLLAGVAGGLDLLGTALVLLPGGLLADRCDRARVLRGAALAGFLLYASLVGAGLAGALTLPHLFAVAVLTGMASGLMTPAESAAVRSVVPTEQLPSALAQMQARQHVASLVGGPLGGALYAVARWVPFLLDTLSFLLAYVLLRRLRTDLRPAVRRAAESRGTRRELTEGFTYLWSRPLFRTLLLYSVGTNLTLNALFVAAELRLVQAGFPAWQIGLVGTAAGVSGVLGAVAAPRLVARFPTGPLTVLVAWSFVPLMVPVVVWNHPAVVAAALSTGVFLNPTGNTGMSSYKLTHVPAELVGRTQSVGQFVGWSTLPLAPAVGGGLLAALGGPAAIGALAVATALVALVPTLSRHVWSVPRPGQWQEHWERAGGGQRLPAGPQARPEPDGPHDRALRPAGAAAGHG